MDSSKEIIEAQLAAYVDGELTDAERADIERHLASNPQHRALIRELMGHRDLLRELPRAMAPAELNQEFCGQLERSALLDAGEESAEVLGRIHRWPQIAAVAAVIFLALGLGIVVYYVLPSSHDPLTNGNLAINDPVARDKLSASQKKSDALKDALAEVEKSAIERSMKRKGTEGGNASEAIARGENTQADQDQTAGARGLAKIAAAEKVTSPNVLAGRSFVTAKEIESLRHRLNLDAQPQGGSAGLYMLVSASDAEAANTQLTSYFRNNGIAYLQADETAAERALERTTGGQAPRSLAFEGANGPQQTSDAALEKQNEGQTAKAQDASKWGEERLPKDPAGTKSTVSEPTGAATPGVGIAHAPVAGGVAVNDDALSGKGAEPTAKGKGDSGEGPGKPAADRKAEGNSMPITDALGRPAFKSVSDKPDFDANDKRLDEARSKRREVEQGTGQPVWVARMNRRQALALGQALSRQEGQRADLQELSGSAVVQIMPAPAMGAITLEAAEPKAASDLPMVTGGLALNANAAGGAMIPAMPGATAPAAPPLAATSSAVGRAKSDPLQISPAAVAVQPRQTNLTAAKPMPAAALPTAPEALPSDAGLLARAPEAGGAGRGAGGGRDGATDDRRDAQRRAGEAGKRGVQEQPLAGEAMKELKKPSDPMDEAVDVYIVVRGAGAATPLPANLLGVDEKRK